MRLALSDSRSERRPGVTCLLTKIRVLAIPILLLLLAAAAAQATNTVEALYDAGELKATVSIDTEGNLYQRAPFVLAVEVATPRWFSRGTRVDDFRIPGAVVRPMSTFADNSSRRVSGDTWSVQRWRFRIFPREAGELTIGTLSVFISVNSEGGVLEGTLALGAPSVLIVPAPGADAKGDTPWVATPSLAIKQSWDGILDSYLPGDAITRNRRFVVEDTPAMMLEDSPIEPIDGLSFYQAPATVNDSSDRGRLIGTREETLIITFEAPGEYEIPGLEYRWFNTNEQRFETLSLPAQKALVIAPDGPLATSKRLLDVRIPGPLLIIASGFSLLALLGLLLWLSRKSRQTKRLLDIVSVRVRRYRLRQAYLLALKQKDSARCIQLLYEHLTRGKDLRLLHRALSSLQDKTSLRQLLEHAYGNGSELPEPAAAASLWKAIADTGDVPTESAILALNPGASSA